MDCKQYQALPMDERSPEDRLALQLAEVLSIRVLFREIGLELLYTGQKVAQVPRMPSNRRANPRV